VSDSTSLDRYEHLYASRLGGLRSSAMRDLMAVTARPEVISLAGGLPYTQAFPPDVLAELAAAVAEEACSEALQYGPTEGLAETRAAICRLLAEDGTPAVPEHVLVTTGGQQVLDLVCRAFVDPGDPVLAEGPTYPGMVPTLMAYQADVRQVDMDADGMRVDALADELAALSAAGRRPKLIYTIPNFHNPAGATLSEPRRLRLLELAHAYDVPVLEDDPYGRLRFEGDPLPRLAALDAGAGQVILLGTFSKILAPGLRLGFAVAPPAITAKLNLLKQGVDLCSSPIAQMLATRFVDGPRFAPYLATLVELYRERRDVMVAAIREHFPPDTRLVVPRGGLFLWVTLPGVNVDSLLPRALAANVAFVPGTSAYLDGRGRESMRLNFSASTADRIEEGIRRLGRVIAEQARIASSLRPRRRVTWPASPS
jgi:2-aminoadipate transaminase